MFQMDKSLARKLIHLTLLFTPSGHILHRVFPATPQMQMSDRNVAFGSTERLVECGEAVGYSRLHESLTV